MNIYITGIAGLVGSNLAKLMLTRNHTVKGCDTLIGGYEDNIPENIEWSNVDICDIESMQQELKGIDVVMALATTTVKGISVTMNAITTGDMLYLDNVGGTMTGDGKFILFSGIF